MYIPVNFSLRQNWFLKQKLAIHLAVIWKAERNPGEGVSVRVICNLVHTVKNKDHGLAAGGFLHHVLAIKISKM